MFKRTLSIATLAASAVLVGPASVASASADYDIAFWKMSESPGDRTMYDSSGNGLDGRVGDEVGQTGATYEFDRLEPDTPPAHPEHVVTVPDDDELDPGTRDFAVDMRLRTSHQFGNIVQKGQATVPGGSFKLQIPNGLVQCWFRGSAGSVLVTAPRAINDGDWHTVRCERDGDGVHLSIDDRIVAEGWGRTGSISNSWPVSIGGKTDCNQVDVGCDYFAGEIDYIAMEAEGDDW
jgi:hypothetical protein